MPESDARSVISTQAFPADGGDIVGGQLRGDKVLRNGRKAMLGVCRKAMLGVCRKAMLGVWIQGIASLSPFLIRRTFVRKHCEHSANKVGS